MYSTDMAGTPTVHILARSVPCMVDGHNLYGHICIQAQWLALLVPVLKSVDWHQVEYNIRYMFILKVSPPEFEQYEVMGFFY
jgi:hypothetical protein